MKMNRYGIFLLVLSLAMVGCLPSSENPLPSQGDITGIAAPFLGNWLLTEMLNRSDVGYMTLDIALQGTTQLEAVRGDGLHTATMALTMHKYGSRIFVTHDRQSEVLETYAIYEVNLSGSNNNTLTVFPLNSEVLENAINSQVITGDVQEVEGSKVIRITDSSANLQSYVTSASDVFDASPIIVFARQN